jgi:hypothetical protein
MHAVRHGAWWLDSEPMMTRLMAQASMRSKLHAATPNPRWQRRKGGSSPEQQRFGGGARHRGCWMAWSGRSPPWFGSYVAQGQHKRETDGRGAHRWQEMRRAALTSSGGRWAQDAAVRVEYSADGSETWGKRSAMTWQSVVRKELMIGGATRWLAGGERAAAAYLSLGENNGERKEALAGQWHL